MATVTTVSFGFTFNRANYQSERIDLAAALDEGEDVVEATWRLKAQVFLLGGDEQRAVAALAKADARARETSEE